MGRESRPPSSERNSPAPSTGPALDLQRVQSEQELHARAWEALKRKEREAVESTDDTLKPAASLTRVDSDTLKVRYGFSMSAVSVGIGSYYGIKLAPRMGSAGALS